MEIAYIAETSLTNKSAYTQHVIKMCDAFSQQGYDVELFLPNISNKIKFNDLKKNFLLRSKKIFKLKSVLDVKITGFFTRIFFAYKTAKHLKFYKKDLILTRSFMSSLFLSFFKIEHIIEIHSEMTSLTKFIFINLNFISSKYIQKKIIISKALNKIYKFKKNEVIILHDGVDINNFIQFHKIKQKKIIKKVVYTGSFYQGRGIEIIEELASKFKNIDFELYGDNDHLKKKFKNIKYYGQISYSGVPLALSKADILLMPYSNNVSVRAKNINTGNYCSPLKMFDYLASGKIIMSSKLQGICEVLHHGKNAIIVKKYQKDEWIKEFNNIISRKYNLNSLMINSIKTAKIYTWNKRVDKIINLIKKK